MSKPKIRTITVDTLTGVQTEMYMSSKKKPNYDKWTDYGKDIWAFITFLQDKGFDIIMILGEPGTGKSTGMRNLPSQTNLWFNADNKNPVWIGGKEEYGKKNNPNFPYHTIPKTYKEIKTLINDTLEHDMFEEDRFAILTGHIEDYRSGNDYKKRLKTLGKLASKMQLEGKLETVMYSEVKIDGEERSYVLTTQNDGTNTARSFMNAFEPVIDNDYNFIIQELLKY